MRIKSHTCLFYHHYINISRFIFDLFKFSYNSIFNHFWIIILIFYSPLGITFFVLFSNVGLSSIISLPQFLHFILISIPTLIIWNYLQPQECCFFNSTVSPTLRFNGILNSPFLINFFYLFFSIFFKYFIHWFIFNLILINNFFNCIYVF